MKKFLILTKILLKCGFGNGIYDDNGKAKKNSGIKKTFMYVFLGICFVPMMGMMGYLGYSGYDMFEGLNTGIILGIACYAGVFLAFFTGMTMCVGVFYNSSDTEFLLPMPLKAEQIVGAKFVTMYLYTLVTDALIILPVFIGYGIAAESGIAFWIIMVFTALVLPVTPLVYGGIFSMVLIRIFKRARNKDMLTVISTLFALVLVLAINAFTSSVGNVSAAEMISIITEKGNSIMGILNKVFPNTGLAEKAMSMEDPLMLILFIASAAAFTVVFILVAKAVYIKSVVEMSATSSKGKKMTDEEMKRAGRKNSQVKAYAAKELKLVARTPIYFLNCMLLSILWPVIFLIPVFAQLVSGGGDAGTEGASEGLGSIVSIDSELLGGICILAVFAVTIFAVSFSMLNTTCISREGKNVIFMKYIPMSYEKQLQGKVIPGILLTLVTGTVYSIIGIAVVTLVYDIHISPVAIVLAIIISILCCVLFNLIEIISDILKPKLEWQSEQAAVKQNFVAIIPMFLTMIIGVLMGIGSVLAVVKLNMPVYGTAFAAAVILAVLVAVVYKLDVALANKYFARY